MVTSIKVTDATIALDDIGEGIPVLLLHGFPATRHLWSRVAPQLADTGFRVLVPDLVGYGASEAPGLPGAPATSDGTRIIGPGTG
jgi:pimeloyl-ACP methyl ester carboxylesterase